MLTPPEGQKCRPKSMPVPSESPTVRSLNPVAFIVNSTKPSPEAICCDEVPLASGHEPQPAFLVIVAPVATALIRLIHATSTAPDGAGGGGGGGAVPVPSDSARRVESFLSAPGRVDKYFCDESTI